MRLDNPNLTWSWVVDRETGHSVLVVSDGPTFCYLFDAPKPESAEISGEFIDGGFVDAFLRASDMNNPRDKMVSHQWISMELLRQYVNRLAVANRA